jgi:RNA polymerase sigma-70 factor (ECF subfamily)
LLDEAMQRLTRIIDELQPNLRQVFVMRYVTQMPRQEIADRLQISVGAVEQRLTRALTHCRERLAAHGIDWAGFE